MISHNENVKHVFFASKDTINNRILYSTHIILKCNQDLKTEVYT